MDLRKILNEQNIVVLDGAMGTELAKRGLEMSGSNNLSHPDQVLEVHQAYLAAGTKALITNTLTMNRISLESHRKPLDVHDVNVAGAGLARQAAKTEQYVLGNLGSTGQLLKPYGDYTEEQFYENFREQAAFLLEGGVDGFIIETMTDLREATCALKACRAVSNLPVIVTFAFSRINNGGRTIMGNSVAEIAKTLEDNGADAVGANCGELLPVEMAQIVSLYKQATSLPIVAEPNAGKPVLIDNKPQFTMKPEEFAAGVLQCIKNGACIVGGCCGTTPAHIRALTDAITKTGRI